MVRRHDLGSRLGKVARSKSFRGGALLTISSYSQYLIPLLSLPIIARTLGADGFGRVSVIMAGYLFGSIFVDLGVSMPLASIVLGRQHEAGAIRRQYLTLRLAALLLLLLSTAVCFLAGGHDFLALPLLGSIAGGVSSLPETWLLAGLQRYGQIALSEWSGRAIYLVILLVGLVLWPSVYVVLLALLMSAATVAMVSWSLVPRSWRHAAGGCSVGTVELLRLGVPAAGAKFLFASYAQSAPFLLASAFPVRMVGQYAASDRLIRAIQAAGNPISLALFGQSALLRSDPRQLAVKSRRIAMIALAVSLPVSILICALAPWICVILYGRGFAPAIEIMRIQAFLIGPAIAQNLLATTYFTVLGRTRSVFAITVCGLTVVAAGYLTARNFGDVRIYAAAAVIAEICTLACGWAMTYRHPGCRHASGSGSPAAGGASGI